MALNLIPLGSGQALRGRLQVLLFAPARSRWRNARSRLLGIFLSVVCLHAPQVLGATTLTFTPVADTYVDAAAPTKAYGTWTSLAVGASSTKQTFLRFQLSGLAGSTVVGVRLRMYNIDGSGSGGRVWTLSSQTWTESTTWDTRPAIDGQKVADFGLVVAGLWYEKTLSISNLADGPLSLAIDSASTNQAVWGSRELRVSPQLLVDVVKTSTTTNEPPLARNDSYGTLKNTPLTVAPRGVLGNDSDADGDALTAVKVTNPAKGKVVLNADGGFTYTPNLGFVGSDSFTYKANDGNADSNTATVTLTVAGTGYDTFEYTPVADTYVDAAQPAQNFGTAAGLWADGDPQRLGYLKFAVKGLSGRTILGARLRLYQTDSGPDGGYVSAVDGTAWNESTVTWENRPATGTLLATFGAVAKDAWYEANLGTAAVAGDGLVAFAVDTSNADGIKWASREHARLPRLLVDVAQVPGLEINGVTPVAADYVGSSDPTYYASQHRLAVTSAGRQLAAYGRHGQGVQLAWREPASGWQTATGGAVQDGLLLAGTGTGDWTASIAIASDPLGEEHAWIVYSRDIPTSTEPVRMRRLSDLDNPAGPLVEPEMTVSAAGLGNSNADIAIDAGNGKGYLAWVEQVTATSWNVKTASFSDLSAPTPAIQNVETVLPGLANGALSPTLTPTGGGMGLVAANAAGQLQLFRQALFGAWTPGPSAPSTSGLYPSAITLSSNDVIATAYSGTTVKVFRFSGDAITTELTLSGYRYPALATDGSRVLLVMVRSSDGYLVSRQRAPDGTWGNVVVESVANGEDLQFRWPNTLRAATDGYLRLVAEGRSSGSRSAVLAYQRPW